MSLPNSNTIPNLLTDAAIYIDGNVLIGTGSVELPAIELATESIAGLGIAGELDAPVLGHTKSMSLSITWNTCNESAVRLLEPKAHQLEVYASIQSYDASSGEYVHKPLKVVVKGSPKKGTIGKVEPGKKMDAETELELLYLKVWLDGKDAIEVDKLNYIYAINGTDYLATIRSNLGK